MFGRNLFGPPLDLLSCESTEVPGMLPTLPEEHYRMSHMRGNGVLHGLVGRCPLAATADGCCRFSTFDGDHHTCSLLFWRSCFYFKTSFCSPNEAVPSRSSLGIWVSFCISLDCLQDVSFFAFRCFKSGSRVSEEQFSLYDCRFLVDALRKSLVSTCSVTVRA